MGVRIGLSDNGEIQKYKYDESVNISTEKLYTFSKKTFHNFSVEILYCSDDGKPPKYQQMIIFLN